MVEKVEQWFNFLPSDTIRIDSDEIHHLVSGALNLLCVEGTEDRASCSRVQSAIKNAMTAAASVCGNYDVLSGDEYFIQIIDSPLAPLSISEMQAINEFCSELRPDVDVVWGTSRNETGRDVGVKIAARNLKITQPWE